jgi:hypothetical protein
MIRPLTPESPYEPIVSWRRAHDFATESKAFEHLVSRLKNSARATRIPVPVSIRLPGCGVTGRAGENLPCLICHDCMGMPAISTYGASMVAMHNSYPDAQHKADHKLHIWSLGFVLHAGHLTFGEDEATIDHTFGPQYALQDLGQEFLAVGSTKLGGGHRDSLASWQRCEMANARCVDGPLQVLNFGARPFGFLRLLLNSVPPGEWTMVFHISTWPAKKAGRINELRPPSIDDEPQAANQRTVKRTRKLQGKEIGRVAFGVGKAWDPEQFFDVVEDEVLAGWRHWAVKCEWHT